MDKACSGVELKTKIGLFMASLNLRRANDVAKIRGCKKCNWNCAPENFLWIIMLFYTVNQPASAEVIGEVSSSVAHVPTLANLKHGFDTWQAALTHWLDGNIICEESKRYVSNFISIYRLRPGDDEDDGIANPDDLVEDEEVVVTKDMLGDGLNTRIGGKASRGDIEDLLGDGHHMNSSEAIELGRNIWPIDKIFTESVQQTKYTFDEKKVEASLKAAASSKSKEEKFANKTHAQTREAREATIANRVQATQDDVQEWLDMLQQRTRTDGRLFVNADQFKAIAVVAKQVIKELPSREGVLRADTDPLRWVVHGGPGTGKTHVVRDVIKNELFDQVLHWQQGLDYQVIALQAVMADLLKGDTIHHACGIPVRKKGAEDDLVIQSKKAVAEQSLYWKWFLAKPLMVLQSSSDTKL